MSQYKIDRFCVSIKMNMFLAIFGQNGCFGQFLATFGAKQQKCPTKASFRSKRKKKQTLKFWGQSEHREPGEVSFKKFLNLLNVVTNMPRDFGPDN